MHVSETEQETVKTFNVFSKIAFELVVAHSYFYQENPRKYLSLTVNVLTNSPKISHITNANSNSIFPRVMKKYDKSAAVQIQAVFGTL